MPSLSASAYVVLGLLDQAGPATPYALDREIQQSVGHFWDFPRSQIYAEAARLVRRGLVTEEREETGRRRRTLALTREGRDTLAAWLTAPPQGATDVRDEGLLRLYFQREGGSGGAEGAEGSEPGGELGGSEVAGVRRLAEAQMAAHRRKLAEYEAILAEVPEPSSASDPSGARFGVPQAAALASGLRFEELAVAFWAEIAEGGAGVVDPRLRGR
ncbi:PadR family transcriptional regulator [Streptomyces sp. CMB-StM0423]|uniref:PadR family transcriptional regulator n=1 Tax=Streptomyces sp. CMB-StM0423 TaxID=2059884 RepID=UPI000C712C3D|nr:helix-turn-helix transcriptional regulator [Streptomyces sp. CMB-StM0423]AUH43153.1 PadR family transcriptional regulator [Streptomyces sp. CMB-StM0423]